MVWRGADCSVQYSTVQYSTVQGADCSVQVLVEEQLADNAERMGALLRGELSQLPDSVVTLVRGRGLLNAIQVLVVSVVLSSVTATYCNITVTCRCPDPAPVLCLGRVRQSEGQGAAGQAHTRGHHQVSQNQS